MFRTEKHIGITPTYMSGMGGHNVNTNSNTNTNWNTNSEGGSLKSREGIIIII